MDPPGRPGGPWSTLRLAGFVGAHRRRPPPPPRFAAARPGAVFLAAALCARLLNPWFVPLRSALLWILLESAGVIGVGVVVVEVGAFGPLRSGILLLLARRDSGPWTTMPGGEPHVSPALRPERGNPSEPRENSHYDGGRGLSMPVR